MRQTAPGDVSWSYAGVRSLYDDGAAEAKDVTRDYHLELDDAPGPKLLSVFGGKITTARHLATEALDRLRVPGFKFTATSTLPGGNLSTAFNAWLAARGAWLPAPLIERLKRAYGTRLERMLEGASSTSRPRPPFRRRPVRGGGPLPDRHRIRAHRRRHILAPHQARGPRAEDAGGLARNGGPARAVERVDDGGRRLEAPRSTQGAAQQFRAPYAQVVADQCDPLIRMSRCAAPDEAEAETVGRADDDAGVEAMVVHLNGTTQPPAYHLVTRRRPRREGKQ